MLSPVVAEMVGTFIMMVMGLGATHHAQIGHDRFDPEAWVSATLGWGVAVFAGASIAGTASGAHLNPVVTIALALCDELPLNQVLPYLGAQFAGALLGSLATWALFRDRFYIPVEEVREKMLRAEHRVPPSSFYWVTAEALGSFVFVLTLLLMGHAEVITPGGTFALGLGPLGAMPVGLLFLGVCISFGGTTGYAINPARDFAPRLVATVIPSFTRPKWRDAWIGLAGPLLGALAAVAVRWLVVL